MLQSTRFIVSTDFQGRKVEERIILRKSYERSTALNYIKN